MDTENSEDGMILKNTINCFRRAGAYPKEGEKYTLFGFIKFFLKVQLLMLPGTVGMYLHLFVTFKAGKAVTGDMIENVTTIMHGTLGAFLYALLFANGNKMIIFKRNLGIYKFGKPDDMDEVILKHEKFVRRFYNSSVCISVVYALQCYFTDSFCHPKYILDDPKFVCGSIQPMWFPVELSHSYLDLYTKIAGLIYVFVYFSPPYVILTLAVGCVDLLVARIRHVKKLLKEIDFSNDENVDEKLRLCIAYYCDICGLVSEMNDCIGYMFAPQYSAMTLTIALLEYQLIATEDIVYAARLAAWAVIEGLICMSGQHLQNESSELRDALYDTNWYDISRSAPPAVRSNFRIFMGQLQNPLCFLAKPIIILNNAFLLAVVKSSYTFMMYLHDMQLSNTE